MIKELKDDVNGNFINVEARGYQQTFVEKYLAMLTLARF